MRALASNEGKLDLVVAAPSLFKLLSFKSISNWVLFLFLFLIFFSLALICYSTFSGKEIS